MPWHRRYMGLPDLMIGQLDKVVHDKLVVKHPGIG